MAKKRLTKGHAHTISSTFPIHPSLHFILFLCIAFVLVVIVGFAMAQVGKDARAALMCPRQNQNDLAEMTRGCPYGVQYAKDQNGCGVLTCKNAPPRNP